MIIICLIMLCISHGSWATSTFSGGAPVTESDLLLLNGYKPEKRVKPEQGDLLVMAANRLLEQCFFKEGALHELMKSYHIGRKNKDETLRSCSVNQLLTGVKDSSFNLQFYKKAGDMAFPSSCVQKYWFFIVKAFQVLNADELSYSLKNGARFSNPDIHSVSSRMLRHNIKVLIKSDIFIKPDMRVISLLLRNNREGGENIETPFSERYSGVFWTNVKNFIGDFPVVMDAWQSLLLSHKRISFSQPKNHYCAVEELLSHTVKMILHPELRIGLSRPDELWRLDLHGFGRLLAAEQTKVAPRPISDIKMWPLSSYKFNDTTVHPLVKNLFACCNCSRQQEIRLNVLMQKVDTVGLLCVRYAALTGMLANIMPWLDEWMNGFQAFFDGTPHKHLNRDQDCLSFMIKDGLLDASKAQLYCLRSYVQGFYAAQALSEINFLEKAGRIVYVTDDPQYFLERFASERRQRNDLVFCGAPYASHSLLKFLQMTPSQFARVEKSLDKGSVCYASILNPHSICIGAATIDPKSPSDIDAHHAACFPGSWSFRSPEDFVETLWADDDQGSAIWERIARKCFFETMPF